MTTTQAQSVAPRPHRSPDAPKLALVLGGGGSKGALQVGLYQAMRELGLRPDLIVGTSVGAINGAFIAAGLEPADLASGWRSLERDRLITLNWSLLWRGLSAESLFSARPLRNLLEESLPRRFDQLGVPLSVVTTHLGAGEACVWERGDLVEALLASCAIPGLLPPVAGHDDVYHIDGSLADNVPIQIARRRGATRIVAMNARTCDRCHRRSTSLADVLGQAFSIAADCKLRGMEGGTALTEDVLLIQPDLGDHVRALDFSQAGRLIRGGYEASRSRLENWISGRPRTPTRLPPASTDESRRDRGDETNATKRTVLEARGNRAE